MNSSVPPPELRSGGRCAYALLAAGRGMRFGKDKLLADLAGKPLWRWAIDAAVEAGFDELHVVTNDRAIAAECDASGWSVHANPRAASGMASSIAVAARATASADRTVIALADMPFVEAAHLQRLARAGRVAFTRYPDGAHGVPAGFPKAARDRLLALEGNRGAGSLDWSCPAVIEPPSPASLIDVDTLSRLDAAQGVALRRLRVGRR